MADEPPVELPAAGAPASRLRRAFIVLLLLVIGAAAVAHAVSPKAALVAVGAVAAVAAAGTYLRHLPRIRHHFNDGRRPPRQRGAGPGLFRRGPGRSGAVRGGAPRPGLARSGAGRSAPGGAHRPGLLGRGRAASPGSGTHRPGPSGRHGGTARPGSPFGGPRPGTPGRASGTGGRHAAPGTRRGPLSRFRRTAPGTPGAPGAWRGTGRAGTTGRAAGGRASGPQPGRGGRRGATAGTRGSRPQAGRQGAPQGRGRARGRQPRQPGTPAGPSPVRVVPTGSGGFPSVRRLGIKWRRMRARVGKAGQRARQRTGKFWASPSARSRVAGGLLFSLLFCREMGRRPPKPKPATYTIHPPRKPAAPAEPGGERHDPRMPDAAQPQPHRPPWTDSRTAQGAPRTEHTGGPPMASPFRDAAEAVTAAFSGFSPENVEPLRDAFKDLPELLEALHKGVAGMAETCENRLPVKQAVVEALQELLPTIAGLRDAAEEVGPLFERVHADDLARIDNPRPGEEVFDYTTNR